LRKFSLAAWLVPGLALLVGILGMSAVWVAAAVLSQGTCSWLALVAAIDMAVLLRLTNAPPGPGRGFAAVLATALAVALSQWLIAATQMGFVIGLAPLASSLRLGPALAWQLSQLNLGRIDWILLLSALPLAAILSQRARRPATPPQ
jgi:hypothetical protein